ncbi:MAG TPA: tyrosine-type recombinase/integrase [Pseudonocardiaceae bacterium]
MAPVWRSYLDDWDRAMRAGNRPFTTRYNYQLAVAQLGDFLAGNDDESDAAEDPTDVQRRHVEAFLAWMIETRSASTAVNKYKGLQQFFRYLVEDEEMARNPLDRIPQPSRPEKLIPVVEDDELGVLLASCAGKSFADRRDAAIIRLLLDTGGRLSEITLLDVDDVDLRRDIVVVRGKGDRQRGIPFGGRTGQALTRYLRVRARHAGADLPALFLAERGRRRLAPNGVKLMLRRRGERAGTSRMHAHRLRHTLAHQWQLHGGNETGLMSIMGWRSPRCCAVTARRLPRSGRSIPTARSTWVIVSDRVVPPV